MILWASTYAGRWSIARPVPAAVGAGLVLLAVLARNRGGAMRFAGACGLALAGVSAGTRAWAVPFVETGECAGWGRLVDDPRPLGRGVSAVIEIDGVRVRAIAHGPPAWRLERFAAGTVVAVAGRCSPPVRWGDRDRVNHVLGRMNLDEVGSVAVEADPAQRAANRVRDIVSRGIRTMSSDDAALFTGLVIGDDRRQPRSMIEDFRASGLSHLCSVSGQNVSYVLALTGPFLRRLRPFLRLVATLGVLGWFVLLTRAEPSVLRAAMMAAVVAVNFWRGGASNARVILPLSVIFLLVVDPMLAHSVGFALSVGATAGLAWFSRPLETRWGLPPVLAATVAAQLGTLPVALAVFGSVPVVSLVANPLAVPVAGVVMLAGIPLAVLAALGGEPVAAAVGAVLTVPVRFVDTVAHVAARATPPRGVALVIWAALALWAVRRGFRHGPVAG